MEITAANQEQSLAQMHLLTKDKLQENLLLVRIIHGVWNNLCMNVLAY